MRYLVDTHILLWWVLGDFRLSKKAVKILLDPTNEIYVSLLAAWEISIKQSSKKLVLHTTVEEVFRLSRFKTLIITFDQILALKSLPYIHKDPFDRLLIAQAVAEGLTIITVDPKIRKYDVKTLS